MPSQPSKARQRYPEALVAARSLRRSQRYAVRAWASSSCRASPSSARQLAREVLAEARPLRRALRCVRRSSYRERHRVKVHIASPARAAAVLAAAAAAGFTAAAAIVPRRLLCCCCCLKAASAKAPLQGLVVVAVVPAEATVPGAVAARLVCGRPTPSPRRLRALAPGRGARSRTPATPPWTPRCC